MGEHALPDQPAGPAPADVLLTDGSVASIHVATARDGPALAALHDRIGDESLRLRFFSPSRVAARAYVDHLAVSPETLVLVAEHRGRLVAVATAEPVGPGTAEVAFLVDDDCHGLGLGSLLLEHLAAAGRDRGVRSFVAEVLAENTAMIAVLLDAGFTVVRRTEAGCVHVEMDTRASAHAVAAADERERVSEARSLRPLLYPRSVAVVGVHRDGTGVGAAIVRSVLAGGFTGSVHVVHPVAPAVLGVPAVASLADLAGPVDLLVVASRARLAVDALRDAAAVGVPAAVVVSSGFEELGEDGARLQREMLALARRHSMRLVGPNCLGLMCNDPEVRLDATFSGSVPPPGGLAVASQSGGVGIVLMDVARELGLGVGSFVSLGNKADVSGNDLLAAWRDDPRVTGAALYLESFGNALKFARVAREFSERKPLLAAVGGRSAGGRRAGVSHTAAAASPTVGVQALFAQAGVVECHGAEDLAETALLLGEQPLPAGARVALLSNAGGMGVLAADLADESGLTVPELSPALRARLEGHVLGTCGTGNPVDAGAGASAADVAALARELLESDEVDALVVLLVATGVSDSAASMRALHTVRAAAPEKPVVLVALGGLRTEGVDLTGITAYRTAEPALRALGRAARYRAWRDQPHEPEEREVEPGETGEAGEPGGSAGASVPEAACLAARECAAAYLADRPGGGWLDAAQARELLRGHGLAPLGELVRDRDEAAAVAARLGFPVAVKVAAGEVVHRTEQGLVRVGLRNRRQVAAAVGRFERALGGPVPVLVQPVVAGVEVALGVVRDPGFGPLVMVAAGGIATELWQDRVFLLPPVSRREAARAVRSLRTWPLLVGYRGGPVLDVASLEEALVRVGRFAEDVPQVAELDLNPVVVGARGCHLVDVKVRLAPCRPLDAGIPRRLRRPT